MSRLGELDYWEDIYSQSLNIQESSSDSNEWFIKEGNNMIQKLSELYSVDSRLKIKILDVGCGSGEFLCKLYSRGFTNLYGFDYSESAIILAKKNADNAGYSINFFNKNVENAVDLTSNGPFDVVIDKGTFDIFFCTNRIPIYSKNIFPLIATNGRYFIVSCNATLDELVNSFDNLNEIKLKLEHQFEPIKTFVFGNKIGQSTTSAIFKFLSN